MRVAVDKEGGAVSAPELSAHSAVDDAAELPLPADGLVARPRLIDRLLGSRDAHVVALIAPAGYSKSTCLTLWDSADDRPFCWLRCQARHHDTSVLIAGIVEALAPVRPFDSGILLALTSPAPDLTTVLDRLGKAIAEVDKPFVLVLDDAHNLTSDGSAEVLAALVENLPEGSQLALSTRSRPPLPLGRLRASRDLVEMGPADLAMTRGEGAELLATLGLELETGESTRIHERAEGWPAALYLAGLVMSGGQNEPAVTAAGFSGDDRVVVEYFREEFFAGLSDEQARFLYLTSVLDELSGPLCDATLESTGSAALLSELAASNAMIIRLDRDETLFRYHHLLVDMLRAELRLREPEAESGLHLRASRWFEAEGNMEYAVDHAIAGGHFGLAGELIWKSFPELSGHGRIATLDRWMDQLGEQGIKASVPAMLCAARQCMIAGHGAEALQWFELAGKAAEADPGSAATYAGDFDLMKASYAPEGNERMMDDADRAIATLEIDAPWQAPAHLYAGVGRHLKGESEAAETLLREAARRGATAAPIIQTLALSQLSLIMLEDGRSEEASRLVSQARRQVEMCGMNTFASQLLVFAVSALQRAREGKVAEARADIEWSRQLLAGMDQFPGWYETEVQIVLGRASLRLGDAESALGFLDEAKARLARVADAKVLREWIEATETAIEGSRDGLLASRTNLTKSELRTLQYLPSHHSFRAIGEQLHLSQNTVKTQANSLYRKLGANSRAEAVMIARRTGLLDET